MDFYSGVPDSLLKDFCAYVDDHSKPGQHVITANEGNAIALAIGYHLSTGKSGIVYLQNSGLGNTINPLTSLADKEVYSVPILLVIGWRGEPYVKDEPQHVKQGRITPMQLDVLEIPYKFVEAESDPLFLAKWSSEMLTTTSAPVALVVKRVLLQLTKACVILQRFLVLSEKKLLTHCSSLQVVHRLFLLLEKPLEKFSS